MSEGKHFCEEGRSCWEVDYADASAGEETGSAAKPAKYCTTITASFAAVWLASREVEGKQSKLNDCNHATDIAKPAPRLLSLPGASLAVAGSRRRGCRRRCQRPARVRRGIACERGRDSAVVRSTLQSPSSDRDR